MKFRLTPVALALAITVLAGCATPLKTKQLKEGSASTPAAAEKLMAMTEAWNDPAVLTEGHSSVVLMTPYAIPDNIRDRKITLALEPGATVKDVVAVLGKLGIPVIIFDQAAADKSFYLPHFNGTLGTLLATVTRATDTWFTWHDGAIVASPTEKIAISVPQESGFADTLGKGLDALGIKDRGVSWAAGMVVMELTPSQFRKVRTYLERITANAAVVNLQVAVVNVTLNQTAKQGIDWDKLSISALRGGNLQDLKNWQTATANATSTTSNVANTLTNSTTSSTSTTSTGTTSTGTTGTDTTANLVNSVGALTFAGNALQGALFGQRFSFQGMFNFLQSYGDAETRQNVLLKTVTGNRVEFKSLTQVPYVSEVGVNASSGTTATTTNTGTTNATNSLGSTKTEKADDGITLEMTPMFDAAANTVTVDMKLSIKAVVAFNELSAGNQIGKLTQPTTADRSFTDTLRLHPGQTVVVGGLTYDSVSDNRGAPVFLQNSKWESQSLTVNRQTMFIVIRPTVMKLGQIMQTEVGDDGRLNLGLPASKVPFVPEPEEVAPAPARGKSRHAKVD